MKKLKVLLLLISFVMLGSMLHSQEFTTEQLRAQVVNVSTRLNAMADELTANKVTIHNPKDKMQATKRNNLRTDFVRRNQEVLNDTNLVFDRLYAKVDTDVQIEGRSKAPPINGITAERLHRCVFHLQELLDKLSAQEK